MRKEHKKMDAETLHEAISAVCPIESVRVGKEDDRNTWSFTPTPEATPEQVALGNGVISSVEITSDATVEFAEFIGRFTNAEYRLLLQSRAAPGSNPVAGMHKDWDILQARGKVKLASQKGMALKADLVSNGILSQMRADAIFV